MKVVHEGVCGPHMNKIVLAKKIACQGYFWLAMETYCVKFIKKCHNYQAYGDVSHLPFMELQGMTSPWLFAVWGINIIGEGLKHQMVISTLWWPLTTSPNELKLSHMPNG